MAGYIGGIECDFLKGNPTGKSQRVETWQQPGVNGYGVQLLGLGESAFKVLAYKYGSSATCRAWANAILAIKGTATTMVVDSGSSYTNVFIVKVEQPAIVAAEPYGECWVVQIEGVVA